MTKPLRCTVIVPTYNRATLVGYTLDSLTRQSLPPDQFEVMVVDDGSTDSTSTVVDSFRDRLDLQYFYQEDRGFRAAKARNVGIFHANAEVCVFIDSGVLLHSGCLDAHLDSHVTTDGPAVVCGYVFCFNTDNAEGEQMKQVIDVKDPDGTIDTLRRRRAWPDIREEFYARYTERFHNLPAPWLMFWTVNVSASTAQLRRVGMFDEAFDTWGGEDLDLGYRLHRDGATFLADRRASSVHYPHEKSFEANLQEATKNYRYMAGKYDTPITRMLAEEEFDDNFFEINDIIRERGLPTCADYLARGTGR